MCLFIDKDKHKQMVKGRSVLVAKRAKKDIAVYKVLEKDGNPPYRSLRVDGKDEPYQKGFTYKEKSFPLMKRDYRCDGRGFHSWMTYKNVQPPWWLSDCKIVKMYIPKGAYYYIGENGDCYSSELKWV